MHTLEKSRETRSQRGLIGVKADTDGIHWQPGYKLPTGLRHSSAGTDGIHTSRHWRNTLSRLTPNYRLQLVYGILQPALTEYRHEPALTEYTDTKLQTPTGLRHPSTATDGIHSRHLRNTLTSSYKLQLVYDILQRCSECDPTRMNEWMNKLYFTRVVEKTRGLFTSSPRPWGKLLLTKDTVSYSVLSTCTFIQFMLKWTPANRETSR